MEVHVTFRSTTLKLDQSLLEIDVIKYSSITTLKKVYRF